MSGSFTFIDIYAGETIAQIVSKPWVAMALIAVWIEMTCCIQAMRVSFSYFHKQYTGGGAGGVWSYRGPRLHEPVVIDFFDFLIAQVFYMKFILRQKYSSQRNSQLVQHCLWKYFNCGQYINNKYIFVSEKHTFQMNCGVVVPKILWLHISVLPLQHLRNSLDFGSFFKFFEKTRDIFMYQFQMI